MYDHIVHSLDENLTKRNVDAIFESHRSQPGSSLECIVVDGLHEAVAFSPRIEMDHTFIGDMLAELPTEFRTEAGVDFCTARTTLFGVQWTDVDADVEMLAQLGVAVNLAEFCLPRAEWQGYPRFRRASV